MIALSKGISLLHMGPSPLPELCPIDVQFNLVVASARKLEVKLACAGFSLDLPPTRDGLLPSINFVRFNSITISSAVEPGVASFGLSAGFFFATGDSMCTDPADRQCLTSSVGVDVSVDPSGIGLELNLEMLGTWLDPLGLLNFALEDISIGFGVKITGNIITPKVRGRYAGE